MKPRIPTTANQPVSRIKKKVNRRKTAVASVEISEDPLTHLSRVDPAMAEVIKRVGAYRLETKETSSLFVSLAEAIVYQQLSGKAAATIYGRVCGLFLDPTAGPTALELTAMEDSKLRSAGLSEAKTRALKDLASKSLLKNFPTLQSAAGMGNDELIEALTKVRGIGPWTVQMLLMFRLGRLDVLPVDDYGVKKGYAKMMHKRKLPTAKELEKIGQKWAPYRTVASWYLWRILEAESV